MIEQQHDESELSWIAILLRLMMAIVFMTIAINQLRRGLSVFTAYYRGFVKNTFLPIGFIDVWFATLPYLQIFLALWLFLGWKGKWAWVASGFLLVILSAGLLMLDEYRAATYNITYLFLVIAGLYFNRYDRFTAKWN